MFYHNLIILDINFLIESKRLSTKLDNYLDLYVESVLPKKTIVDYDEINNPYNITSLLKSSNLGTLVTIDSIIGIDPESFKPNSNITVKITDDDKKDGELSGVYSLLAGSISFERAKPDEDKIICGISNIVLSRMES